MLRHLLCVVCNCSVYGFVFKRFVLSGLWCMLCGLVCMDECLWLMRRVYDLGFMVAVVYGVEFIVAGLVFMGFSLWFGDHWI